MTAGPVRSARYSCSSCRVLCAVADRTMASNLFSANPARAQIDSLFPAPLPLSLSCPTSFSCLFSFPHSDPDPTTIHSSQGLFAPCRRFCSRWIAPAKSGAGRGGAPASTHTRTPNNNEKGGAAWRRAGGRPARWCVTLFASECEEPASTKCALHFVPAGRGEKVALSERCFCSYYIKTSSCARHKNACDGQTRGVVSRAVS